MVGLTQLPRGKRVWTTELAASYPDELRRQRALKSGARKKRQTVVASANILMKNEDGVNKEVATRGGVSDTIVMNSVAKKGRPR